eukprot:scaffold75395_cov48-Phaeocystis_antarctica.AAC.1
MPDGATKRNQTPPTHVPWTGGVMGTALGGEHGRMAGQPEHICKLAKDGGRSELDLALLG